LNISRVLIREYRNIQNMDIKLSRRANVFIGLNGQGKTNFLEAIYVSLRGNSFRTQNHSDLIRKSEQPKTELTRVSMSIQRDRVEDELQTIILDQKKVVKLNGKPTSAVKLLTEFPLVLFSPDSLSAIKDGPEERRNLMNEMVLLGNPQNHRIINDYQRALRARNRFLKEAASENRTQKINYDLLGALSETLFNLAIELIEARKQILRELVDPFRKIAGSILKGQMQPVDLGYLMSDQQVLHNTRSEIEQKLHQRRVELYDAELRSRTTLWGPHKHDMIVTYSGNSARFFCSQGQQRALILALKISQIVHHFECYGKYPILLLDDVFSELDRERRTYLLGYLSDLKTQSILTSTDTSELTDADVFEVSSGRGALVRSKSVDDSAERLFS